MPMRASIAGPRRTPPCPHRPGGSCWFLRVQGDAASLSWCIRKDSKTLAHGQLSPGPENTAPLCPWPCRVLPRSPSGPAPAWHCGRPVQALIIASITPASPSIDVSGGRAAGLEGMPTAAWHLHLTIPGGILRTSVDRKARVQPQHQLASPAPGPSLIHSQRPGSGRWKGPQDPEGCSATPCSDD